MFSQLSTCDAARLVGCFIQVWVSTSSGIGKGPIKVAGVRERILQQQQQSLNPQQQLCTSMWVKVTQLWVLLTIDLGVRNNLALGLERFNIDNSHEDNVAHLCSAIHLGIWSLRTSLLSGTFTSSFTSTTLLVRPLEPSLRNIVTIASKMGG